MTDLDTSRLAVLSGRYALGDVIGRGGMGVVHRAWDLHLKRYVAVKILRGVAMDPVGRARFRAEGQTLARLSHPGLITLLDAETEGDEPYLVMELVDGEPLAGLCQGQRMDVDEVVVLGTALAEALDHVHRRRIIHRDVTPSNVLIGRDGRVKLADFGVARLLDGISRHTATGMMLGTAAYLSPEQVRREPLTAASDIYSLGLVLIEALSGEPAFVGSWDVVALARLTTSPRIDEALPEALRELLAGMTAADPAQRPAAAEVAIALRSLVGGSVPVVASGQRFERQITPEHSADLPTSVGLELPADVVTASSRGPVPQPTRSRRRHGARTAAAVLLPALALVLVPGIDWPGGPAGPGPRPGSAEARTIDPSRPPVRPTERTELPAPAEVSTRSSKVLVGGSPATQTTSAATSTAQAAAQAADRTAVQTKAEARAEAKAADKAAAKAARAEARAARQAARDEAKADRKAARRQS